MARSGKRQIAALPVRQIPEGGIEVLLVTTRETRRWIIPKGWPWRKLPDHEAAAGEAWEEAGVRGLPQPELLGRFTYGKRRSAETVLMTVDVYLLEVSEELANWPEAKERTRAWFSLPDAAEAVQEPELKALLLSFGGKGSLR